MLINLSNHPSSLWSGEQISEANSRFGNIVDLPFPAIDPFGDETYIDLLVDKYLTRINGLFEAMNLTDCTVHLMGEMNFTYALVNALKNKGIRCVASTTVRNTTNSHGLRVSEFRFVRFREY